MRRPLILALLAACLAGLGLALARLGALSAHPLSPAELVRPRTAPQVQPAAEWFEQIFRGLRREEGPRENRERSWEGGRDRLFRPLEEERRQHRPVRPLDDDERESRMASGYFRTMCVRLCDGLPIAMSFSTPRSQFARDARRCAQACPGGRLFVYRNPGGELQDMVDLDGRAYRQLPTAFLHQSTYVENCTCHGNPWDQEALARHQSYAAQATPQSATAAERKLKPPPRREGRRSSERWVQYDMEDRERR